MCSATRLLCARASGVGSGSAISREWKEYSGIILGHERTPFRESCARHRRREARRSSDRPPPASTRREPDAALPGIGARGEGAARRVERRARRFRGADSGRLARSHGFAGNREEHGRSLREARRADQQRFDLLSDPGGEMTQATWDSLIGANLRAPLFLSQAAAPHLKKTGGAIVNITDIHVDRPLKNYVIYSIAKAGLAGLTRSLARELAPDVRVNG